jgi:predicted small lipoprotein YifL
MNLITASQRTLAILLLVAVISACGQKGPLYLPPKEGPAQKEKR